MTDPKQHLRSIFNDLARQNYFVPDLLTEESRFLFLLESPHIEELKHGAPVSGQSGSTMSRHLYGDKFAQYPLGRMLKRNRDAQLNRPALNKVGLLNVCNIPLQARAYRLEARTQYRDFFPVLESVRTQNHIIAYPDQAANLIQEIIADSLRRKLLNWQGRQVVLVPCGRFAQKFLRLADVHSPQWQIIANVPHPSRDSWSEPRYAAVVRQVQDALQQI
ncbi:uracil-DNA glycosylase family protein [Tumebacillus permanentifrigoris]|uniref:Uracil-DNA glycosylase-like domain-containing protein n=1 Tax=Tumebacillus permanentifrigoris TaxID=378543 RepID=A0A316D464_9BACL|nr:uracil-DNA glycosylase family protein [Tumebacillus permanentifrigoris]PWK05184.1 hypothetical protein C7459_1256 [Tumebacillus permanentifrigoris]